MGKVNKNKNTMTQKQKNKNIQIVSWNVNGIRAWFKKGCQAWFFKQAPDFFCIQETKAHPEQLPEELRNANGYFSYFDHARVRKGYSGVAIYTKHEPKKVEYGFGIEELDNEGRQIALLYEDYVLINCYFPNGGSSPEKFDFKLKYFAQFAKYLKKLEKHGYKKIIFCGDVNVAHNEIDLARPKENANSVGFLPIERQWVDSVVASGYIDTFRNLYPEKVAYSWWDMKTFSRERNVGWRIDYFFVSSALKNSVTKSEILGDVFGSDHCPILLEVIL